LSSSIAAHVRFFLAGEPSALSTGKQAGRPSMRCLFPDSSSHHTAILDQTGKPFSQLALTLTLAVYIKSPWQSLDFSKYRLDSAIDHRDIH
jgi:hypothetical protein